MCLMSGHVFLHKRVHIIVFAFPKELLEVLVTRHLANLALLLLKILQHQSFRVCNIAKVVHAKVHSWQLHLIRPCPINNAAGPPA